jgi:hypothetical protein
MIPVTDHLPIALRAYVAAKRAKPRRSGIGPSSWTLVFDCETAIDAGQSLRFGSYQLRNGERLVEAGFFYDQAGTTAAEVSTLRAFAKREGLLVRTRDEFVDEILFRRAYQFRARIVGFNLPFDISRLAIAHGPARGAMYGGFTFTLSDQPIWPHIRIKHLSRRIALIDFAAPFRQRDSRGQRNRGIATPVRRGYFVDLNTLSAALLSQGFTLGSLSKFLGVTNPKLDFDDFDGPVTDAMLRYAVRDVQTTWECHVALLAKLDQLELADVQPEHIYSEASIGKAYLHDMGIAPWRISQPDFAPQITGPIMASYYGGRSEIRIRREVRQVILCDFLSMYPTVCTLMGLWRFVIASGMVQRDATEETRDFLASVTLADLQSSDLWPKLATLVRVLPDADIFPVRANYGDEPLATIGANHLSSEPPLWFTLADCIASTLLTGKAPRIVEAIAFVPGPVQERLNPINISGNPDYRVDPTETDFFRRVIELRKATQARMAKANGKARDALDAEQHALKICANSTSYGIWMQVNVARKAKRLDADIYGHNGQPFTHQVSKAETPGEFFHPLLASLITGAARLMLAITECQIESQGLEWAFCDTDSMAIAKSDAMANDEFRHRVKAITNWFAALNPYDFGGSTLKVESENSSLVTGEPQPLYCWAVSSKRYALFNLASDGTPMLRKVSAHGLGHLQPPYNADNAPADIPAPPDSVLRSGVERWHCDLWYQIVSAALEGKPNHPRLDFHPAMNAPAISRYGATAPDLLRWFGGFNAYRSYRNQVKPFGFLLSLRAKRGWDDGEAIDTPVQRGRPRKARAPKPVAPFDRDPAKAAATAFDRETSEPVPATALQSYAQTLAQYHLHTESKFIGGDYLESGTTRRRHIHVTGIRHIGKEADEWERQAVLGLDDEAVTDFGLTAEKVAELDGKLAELVAGLSMSKAAKAVSISPAKLRSILSGGASTEKSLASAIASRLPAAFDLLELERTKQTRELLRLRCLIDTLGLRRAARQLGLDPSNLKRRVNTLSNANR